MSKLLIQPELLLVHLPSYLAKLHMFSNSDRPTQYLHRPRHIQTSISSAQLSFDPLNPQEDALEEI